MDKIRIIGGKPLFGKVVIGGAKNSALPVIISSLLTKETLTLSNVPNLADINTLHKILTELGVKINNTSPHSYEYTAETITSLTASYDLVKTMRASVLVLGALLARFSECKVALPGGCAIGARPVNFHLEALKKMGAYITIENGYINAKVNGKLKGAIITFPKVSVGATENILMAASLAEGTTVINNAAQEPEITDLAECLIKMGADITGLGTNCLVIKGKEELNGASHSIVPDRIEAITYAIAAAITRGEIEIINGKAEHIRTVLNTLTDMGVSITETKTGFISSAKGKEIRGTEISTSPYPGFPTDAQAQIMSLMITANSPSIITETVFENRFMHVPELQRMNADLEIKDEISVLIKGNSKLIGAPVMASDLRASAGLVLAGLYAEGETIIDRVYHLDRGYEALESKLSACGADISRITED